MFEAAGQAVVRALVGEKKMLQYLCSAPLSRGSRSQLAGADMTDHIFEFVSQAFEIGNHGSG